MKRQHDLHDLLAAAAAMARAPAAFITVPERGQQIIAATFGALPEPLYAPQPVLDQPFLQKALAPEAACTREPWCYAFEVFVPIPLVPEQGIGSLCFLSGKYLDPEATSFKDGLRAIIRQMSRLLLKQQEVSLPVSNGYEHSERSSTGTDALPSIDNLPGIGTFEIRFGSNMITLSAELMRLTGVPTGTQCPMHIFQQCMPEPDSDLIRFAKGERDYLDTTEIDFAIESMTDQRKSWVRRRAEIEADDRGKPWRIIGTLEDITRDRVATNRLSAMVMLGDALRKVSTPAEAYQAAASALGNALVADRAGWASFDLAEAGCFRVAPDWHGAACPTAAGTYAKADYAVALKVVEQGLLLAIRDTGENIWIKCPDPLGRGGDRIRAQLLMPVLNQGRMTHCLFVQSCTPRDWTDQELAFLRAVSDRAQAAAASLEARLLQQTMHQELAHRLKNTLALVQALANQSLRGVDNREAVKAFEKRLIALGSAHDLLMKQAWQSGDLETLARDVLVRIAPIERFQMKGPPISLGPNTATTFGLMLHELGTNAAKYGALSTEKGHVELSWRVDERAERLILSVKWQEVDGPPVVASQVRGFGSRLLHAGFGHQGTALVRYPETGCSAEFTLPLLQAQGN